MKRKIISVVVVAVISISVFASAAYAHHTGGTYLTQITNNPLDETNPDIYVNPVGSEKTIVYEQLVSYQPGKDNDCTITEDNNDCDIKGKRGTTSMSSSFDVITAPCNQLGPQVSGNWVVFRDYRPNSNYTGNCIDSPPYGQTMKYQPRVYAKNIVTGELVKVSSYDYNQSVGETSPRIDGNNIVWTETNGSVSNIKMFNLSTRQVSNITSSGDAKIPDISGNVVAWLQNYNVVAKNISTGQFVQVTTDSNTTTSNIKVSGANVVWQRFGPNSYGVIYTMNISKTTNPIKMVSQSATTMSYNPEISNNIIVYECMGGCSYSSTGSTVNLISYDVNTSISTIHDSPSATCDQWRPNISRGFIVWHDSKTGSPSCSNLNTYNIWFEKL